MVLQGGTFSVAFNRLQPGPGLEDLFRLYNTETILPIRLSFIASTIMLGRRRVLTVEGCRPKR
jgi:hypothetical protein